MFSLRVDPISKSNIIPWSEQIFMQVIITFFSEKGQEAFIRQWAFIIINTILFYYISVATQMALN